jgi:molybdate transport system regulatory protein
MSANHHKRMRPESAPESAVDKDDAATLRLQMWFETPEGVLFGMGRLILLQQIAESGSLKAASEKLGMSYRAAWGKLKTTEKIMGISLTEKHSGNRSGYRLSPAGESLCRKYRELMNDVESFALDRAVELLAMDVHGYGKGKDA